MEYEYKTDSDIRLNEEAVSVLRESAKWAYFLAIVGFVGIALLVVFSFFVGSFYSTMTEMSGQANPMSDIDNGVFTAIYLLIAVLYFFPVYYLFKFASSTKAALANSDSDMLTNGLTYLKSHYKYIGILMLIILSIYLLIFVFAMIGLAFVAAN